VQHHGVEAGVGQRQVPAVALLEGQVVDAGAELSGSVEQDRQRVDGEHLTDARAAGELARDRARAAADLQHSCVADEREVGEVGGDHLAVLWVGGADLHRIRDLRDHSSVDRGDDRIDVRH